MMVMAPCIWFHGLHMYENDFIEANKEFGEKHCQYLSDNQASSDHDKPQFHNN